MIRQSGRQPAVRSTELKVTAHGRQLTAHRDTDGDRPRHTGIGHNMGESTGRRERNKLYYTLHLGTLGTLPMHLFSFAGFSHS